LYYNEDASEIFDPSNETQLSKTLDLVPIVFYWDDFSTTIETSVNGTFSIILPEGSVVDAIAQLGTNLKLVNGTQFTVETGMDEVTMVARPGQTVNGAISINRADNYYNTDVGGWESVTVIAKNLDYDVTWRAQSNDGGAFDMVLPKGTWNFSVESDDFVSGVNTTTIDNTENNVEILIYPEDSLLSIDFFLDNTGDNNITNGTSVNYGFRLLSLIGG
jgi:hypothetical protein